MTFEFEMATKIRQLEKQMRFVMGLESLAGFEQEPSEQINANGTVLDIGAIADGNHLRRSGTNVIGHDLMGYIASQINAGVKIIAVKSAVFTGTQSSSVASGGNVAITDLSISHACAHEDNQILLLGQVGLISDSSGYASPSPNFTVDNSDVGVGDAAGTRSQIASGFAFGASGTNRGRNAFIAWLYAPEDTSSHTYRVIVKNVLESTITAYINRTQSDDNAIYRSRASSTLIIAEVSA
jgi:hypothetical protein